MLPYSFYWSTLPSQTFPNTEDLSNLSAGLYTIYLVDANNCYIGIDIDVIEDLGSQTCPELPMTGLFIDGIIDDRVNANFDNMNTYDASGNQVCRVDQIRIQYRPVGTNS